MNEQYRDVYWRAFGAVPPDNAHECMGRCMEWLAERRFSPMIMRFTDGYTGTVKNQPDTPNFHKTPHGAVVEMMKGALGDDTR